MRFAAFAFFAFTFLVASPLAAAEPNLSERPRPAPPFRLDTALSFSRFEQQVKVEIGGARGQRLVESSELGFSQTLAYRPFARVPVSLGAFVRFDVGSRRAGRFAGFDGEGRAVIADATGGPYYELWLGPLLRAEWRFLFVELGYGAYALRHDEGRADLPNASGNAEGALRTSPAVAFRLGAGVEIALPGAFAAILFLEYRVRYYDRRGGEELAGNVVHGTQNFTPFFGLSYRFGAPPAEAASLP